MQTGQAAASRALHDLLISLRGLIDDADRLGERAAAYRYARMLVDVVEASGHDGSCLFLSWTTLGRLANLQIKDGLLDDALASLEQAWSIASLASEKPEPDHNLFDRLPWVVSKTAEGSALEWFLSHLEGKRFAALKEHPGYSELVAKTKAAISERSR